MPGLRELRVVRSERGVDLHVEVEPGRGRVGCAHARRLVERRLAARLPPDRRRGDRRLQEGDRRWIAPEPRHARFSLAKVGAIFRRDARVARLVSGELRALVALDRGRGGRRLVHRPSRPALGPVRQRGSRRDVLSIRRGQLGLRALPDRGAQQLRGGDPRRAAHRDPGGRARHADDDAGGRAVVGGLVLRLHRDADRGVFGDRDARSG